MYPEEVASASGTGLYTCRCFLASWYLQMTAAYAMESCECSQLTQALQAQLATVSRALLGRRALPARVHLTPAWSHKTAPHKHEYFVRQLCITALYKGHSMLASMLDGSRQVS